MINYFYTWYFNKYQWESTQLGKHIVFVIAVLWFTHFYFYSKQHNNFQNMLSEIHCLYSVTRSVNSSFPSNAEFKIILFID